ncbi:MAG: hypothetical protein ACTTKP_08545 [Catonella sp.]|uniref:hypothetical protein n=1 Tax=Catonella sp. TaxID=2382125 RepID=UPI003FA04A79
MRKKHFAGVLMLTAAVALGTVSPVVMPGTAIEVKAETNYEFNAGESAAYTGMVASVSGDRELTLTKDGIKNVITTNVHYVGFGATVSKAIEDAVKSKRTIKTGSEDNKIMVDVPENLGATVVLAIVKDGTVKAETPNTVIGGSVDSIEGKEQAKPDTADVKAPETYQIAGAGLQWREKGKTEWNEVDSNNSFPHKGTVGLGTVKEFEVRKKHTANLFASPVHTVKLINQRRVTLPELISGLKFTLSEKADTLMVDGYKSFEDEKLSADIKYKVTAADEAVATALADKITGFSDTDKNIKIEATNGQPDAKIKLVCEKTTVPTGVQVKDKYQIKITNYDKNADYYLYKNALDPKAKPAEVKEVKEGNDTVHVIDVMDHTGGSEAADKNYKIKAILKDKAVTVKSTGEGKVVLPAESAVIEVKAVDTSMDDKKFYGIKVTTDNDKATLKIDAASIGSAKDEVTYEYAGQTGKLMASTPASLSLRPGKLTIKVKGNEALTKTINFNMVSDRDGQPFEAQYRTPGDFLNRIGDKTKYLIRKKGDTTAPVSLKDFVFAKETAYEVSPATAEITASVTDKAINHADFNKAYLLPGSVIVTITERASSAEGNKAAAYVPSTPLTIKKEEPKKEEPKKEEPKKDETKKTEEKKTEEKKTEENKTEDKKTEDKKATKKKKAKKAKKAKKSTKKTKKAKKAVKKTAKKAKKSTKKTK